MLSRTGRLFHVSFPTALGAWGEYQYPHLIDKKQRLGKVTQLTGEYTTSELLIQISDPDLTTEIPCRNPYVIIGGL